MTSSMAEQLSALYTPEQRKLLAGVSAHLRANPKSLDTHKVKETKDGNAESQPGCSVESSQR